MRTWIQIVGAATLAGAAGGLALLATGITPAERSAGDPLANADAPRVVAVSPFGSGPARFEPNVGQSPPEVRWLVRGPRHATFLADDGFTTVVHAGPASPEDAPAAHGIRLSFVGANRTPRAVGESPLPCRTNYFRGRDPSAWIRDVPQFARVRLESVWPGIDVVFRGRDGRLEYDFLVAPGADAGAIALELDGADDARVGPDGDLVLEAGDFVVRHLRPVVWQESPSGPQPLACAFDLEGGRTVRFRVTGRDPGLRLVIDPCVEIGHRIGFSGADPAACVDVGTDCSTVVGGSCASADFVGTGPLAGARSGATDAYLCGFPSSETPALPSFVNVFGGAADDGAVDCEKLPDGSTVVTGWCSAGFPQAGGPPVADPGGRNGFLCRFSGDGSQLLSSAPFGGDAADFFTSLDVHVPAGNLTSTRVYAAGFSDGVTLPGIPGLSAGRNAVCVRFTLGGTRDAGIRVGEALNGFFTPVLVAADDETGRIYVSHTAQRDSFTLPPGGHTATTTAALPGAVLSAPGDLSAFDRGTFVTGSFEGPILGLDVGPGTCVVVTGFASSGTFPTSPNAAQPDKGTANLWSWLSSLDLTLSQVLTSSYLGASGNTTVGSVEIVPGAAGPLAVIAASSNGGVTPTADGRPYPGGTNQPMDPVLVLAPATGGPFAHVTYLGSPAVDLFSSGTSSAIGVSTGRYAAVSPAGTVVVVFDTRGSDADLPGLTGTAGIVPDAVVRSVTSTASHIPPVGGAAVPVDLTVLPGSFRFAPKSRGDGFSAKFRIAPPDGGFPEFDEGSLLSFAMRAPTSVTGTSVLFEDDFPLAGFQEKKGGQVLRFRTPRGEMPAATITLNLAGGVSTIVVSKTDLPFVPSGTPLFGAGGEFDLRVGDAAGSEFFRFVPGRGTVRRTTPLPDVVLGDLRLSQPTVAQGQPFTFLVHLEGTRSVTSTVNVAIEHKGFRFHERDVALPAFDPVRLLAGTSVTSAAVVTPPPTGAQPFVLFLDDRKSDAAKGKTTK